LPADPPERQAYTEAYFEFTESDHGTANRLFADVAYWIFQPRTALDIGSGSGSILQGFLDKDVDAFGIDKHEASRTVADQSYPGLTSRITIASAAEQKLQRLGRFDLVTCIEVLEHLPESEAAQTVQNICALAPRCVVTACPPMGRNPLHLNEQYFNYWTRLFASSGHSFDGLGTLALKSAMLAFTGYGGFVIPSWFYSDWIGVFVE
jgi:hypothetical protein